LECPVISCIVPVHNGEKYLAEALDSIFRQTYRPLEVLVVDDESTDGSAGVAARYGDRIRYVRQRRSGAPIARNLGLNMAAGEFVGFLDADDLWHPEKLERQFACFQVNPGIDLCITHVENFWIPKLKAEAERFRNQRLTRPVPGYVTQSLLARRDLFDRVGPFDTALQHGDAQDWFLRAAEKGAAMKLLADVLVYRRLHETNFSRQVGETFDDHLRIIKASLDRRRRGETDLKTYVFPNSKTLLENK
jgi:glycosyltransferase involved in cell wall biosynthesis